MTKYLNLNALVYKLKDNTIFKMTLNLEVHNGSGSDQNTRIRNPLSDTNRDPASNESSLIFLLLTWIWIYQLVFYLIIVNFRSY